ncbi:hypothetical protein MMPV_001516 [Pyropia vietnamensis]
MDTVLVATSANPRVLPSGSSSSSPPPPSSVPSPHGSGVGTPAASSLAATGGAAPPGDPFCGAITILSLVATVLRDGLRSVPRAAAVLDLLASAVGRRGATDGRIRRLPLRVLTLVDLATAAADNRLVRVGGGGLGSSAGHGCALRAAAAASPSSLGGGLGDRQGGGAVGSSAGRGGDWGIGDAGGTLCVVIGRASAASACGDGCGGCGEGSCWTAGSALADGPAAPGEQLLVEVVPYDQDACAICLGE